MVILYANKKTEKLCSNFDEMKKFFSSELRAKKLAVLMTHLKSIDHIEIFCDVSRVETLSISRTTRRKKRYI